jgi:hypothetical protein
MQSICYLLLSFSFWHTHTRSHTHPYTHPALQFQGNGWFERIYFDPLTRIQPYLCGIMFAFALLQIEDYNDHRQREGMYNFDSRLQYIALDAARDGSPDDNGNSQGVGGEDQQQRQQDRTTSDASRSSRNGRTDSGGGHGGSRSLLQSRGSDGGRSRHGGDDEAALLLMPTMSPWLVAAMYVTTAMLLMWPAYGTYWMYNRESQLMTATEGMLYTGFARIAWACGVGLLAMICLFGHGGWIARGLEAGLWSPLSKLTYSAYLVHEIIIEWSYFSRRTLLTYDVATFIMIYIGVIAAAYSVALVSWMLVEKPCMNIEMALIKWFKQRRSK